jgi:two-component system response regulator ArlR
MNPARILIIEDEKQIARFLELELQHEGYLVDIATDGMIGLQKYESLCPDLVLLDIMLPVINGMDVCQRIRETSEVPIIMLTAIGDTNNKVKGLDLGANDFITKPFVIEELLARIRVALRAKIRTTSPESDLHIFDLTMDLLRHCVVRKDVLIDLTKKEYDLLEYLLRNKSFALTRSQILDTVWGYDYEGDTNIVDVYIRYLRSKIDDAHDVKLIQTIRGVGYMLREDSQ